SGLIGTGGVAPSSVDILNGDFVAGTSVGLDAILDSIDVNATDKNVGVQLSLKGSGVPFITDKVNGNADAAPIAIDNAEMAKVATGAAYYYFRSKEEMVMAFYLLTAEEARSILPGAIARTKDLRKRIHAIIDLTFQQLSDHRSLLGALMKVGLDPKHPLSPMGDETTEIREAQIENFRRALEGSDVTLPKELAPHLPRLFWFYQLGLIAFWIYDDSSGRKRTLQLFDGSLDLIVQLIRLSTLPLMGTVRKRVLNVLRAIEE
ncbi:MAG: hypothetical protein ABI837_09305, partial [Acidobacteriota bacterium]